MGSIDRTRELLKIAERGQLAALGDWLAPRLKHYLTNAPKGVSIDQALDLAVKPGRAPWWREETLRQRDDALRELANQHFGSLDLNGQANAILQAIRRYRGGRWRFDRFKQRVGPDAFEIDDTPEQSTVMPVDGTVSQFRTFHQSGDTDWVTFFGLSGEAYTLRANEVGATPDVVLEL